MKQIVLIRTLGTRLLATLVVLNLGVILIVSYLMLQARQQSEAGAVTNTQNLAQVLESTLCGHIDNINLTLQVTADEIARRMTRSPVDAEAINAFILLQERRLPEFVVALRFVDARGDLRFGSDRPLPAINNAELDFFVRLKDDPKAGLFIAKPRVGKTTGRKLLTFARRVNGRDGQFLGVVYGSMELNQLSNLFAMVDIGRNGSIALRNTDLQIIVRHPEGTAPALTNGSRQISGPFAEAYRKDPVQGTYISGKTSIDGIVRTHSYRKLLKYPLVVNVGLAEMDYLQGWYRRVWTVALLCLVFMASTVWLSVSLARSLQRNRRSEDRFRALAEAAPVPVALNDDQQHITYLNPAFTRAFGYTREDIPTLADWWPKAYPDPQYRQWVIDTWGLRAAESLRKHLPFEPLEVDIRCKDGTLRTVIAAAAPLGNAGEFEDNHLVTLFDITERKQLEISTQESEERLRLALEGAGDGIWDWNIPAGKVMFSKRLKSMLGYTDEEFGDSVTEWEKRIHPDDMPNVMEDIQRHLRHASGTYVNEHRLLCKDGSYKWILDRGMLVKRDANGKPLRMIGTHTDISRLKEAEITMRQARDIAEHAAQVKAAFLANMSHEIRTPMNGVIGLTQLALNQPASPELRDYLNKISTASQSLLGILNDILDLSKLESGHLTISAAPYDLDVVVDTLRGLFETRARSNSLGFDIRIGHDVPRDLIGDAMRLQQVLSNLVGNAIKFTERGSILLEIKLVRLENAEAVIDFSVIDTGIGISDADREKLFQPFSQVDESITRRFGGTGLGLSISQNLLQIMGSEFRLESTPGHGSKFAFELVQGVPATTGVRTERHRRPSRESTLKQLASRSHRYHGLRILVVEDNPINQQVISEFLALSGVQVGLAKDGRQALDALAAETFDAVLMDVQMPVMDGLEATRRIRAEARFATLPVIALSAGVTEQERAQCLASGMNDFIAKPVNPEALIKMLEKWGKGTIDTHSEISPASPPAFDLDLPGFKLDNLMRMLGGDPSSAFHVLQSFRSDMASLPAEIAEATARADFSRAGELAHKIKGAAGSAGAFRLHAAAALLEADYKNGSIDAGHQQDFQTAFDQAMAAVAELKEPLPMEARPEAEAFLTGAAALDSLLAEHVFIDEEMLNTLSSQLPNAYAGTFRNIVRRIHEIRYEEARELLGHLVANLKGGRS